MREEEEQCGDGTDVAMTVLNTYQNAQRTRVYKMLNSDDGRGLKSGRDRNRTEQSSAEEGRA